MTPFSTKRITLLDATPVLLASWTRGANRFDIFVRNDSDTGTLYIAPSPTATIATAYAIDQRNEFVLNIPALAYSIAPTEYLYGFIAPPFATDTTVLIGAR